MFFEYNKYTNLRIRRTIMKKLLTTVFAGALALIMLTFTACAPTSSDPTYSGNYQEVDAQTLYSSTRNVTDDINNVPTVDQKAGMSITYAGEVTTQTNTYSSTEKIAVSGKVISFIETTEAGQIRKTRAAISIVSNGENVIDGKKSYINTTQTFYIDGDKFYIHLLQNSKLDDKPQTIEIKYQASAEDFYSTFNGLMDNVDIDTTENVPTVESEFIDYINNLVTNAGYKFSMDSNDNGLKIKVDLANKEKFENYTEENDDDYAGFDTSVQKMEMYFVFDNEGNLTATKLDTAIKHNSAFGIITLKNFVDCKAYTGNIVLPSDLDDYVDLSQF